MDAGGVGVRRGVVGGWGLVGGGGEMLLLVAHVIIYLFGCLGLKYLYNYANALYCIRV